MLQLLDLTLRTPQDNLALDEDLLTAADREAAAGRLPIETLRFWESPVPVVVMGLSANPAEDLDLGSCSRAGIPVLRRTSGGGAVVLGPGCLSFALALSLERRPELRVVSRSYALILNRIAGALGLAGVTFCGVSDLALDGRKFSGNAQRRTRYALLHHGTILYDFDLSLMPLLLREPAKQPPYRAGRRHEAFVRNLPLPVAEIKSRIAAEWGAVAVEAGRFTAPRP